MKRKKWNKKGFIWFIWGGAALFAGIGYLISQFKPEQTGLASIPIYVWVVGGLILLIMLKKK